jgi:hypothetical protein
MMFVVALLQLLQMRSHKALSARGMEKLSQAVLLVHWPRMEVVAPARLQQVHPLDVDQRPQERRG